MDLSIVRLAWGDMGEVHSVRRFGVRLLTARRSVCKEKSKKK